VRVKNLIYYPIKSCKGTEIDSAQIDPRGIENDRSLMVIAEDGSSITQREFPKMSLIEPLMVEQTKLQLLAPDMPRLEIDLLAGGDEITARVWKQPYRAVDQGEEVSRWLSDYLGIQARLARIGTAFERVVPFATDKTAQVSFADHFPVVITTQEALDHLNSKLTKSVQMSRYRPNIVLEGSIAFEEYAWTHIQIGPVLFEITRVCDRCSVTTVDQESASTSCESLSVLSTFKVVPDSRPVFGLHAAPSNFGKISVTSPVSVYTLESDKLQESS
jgi:uncharacterized protein